MEFSRLKSAIEDYYPSPDLDLIERAYTFAKAQHEHQVRASGEPYFLHVFETAILACELKLDQDSVAAALLHDVIEDCGVLEAELRDKFNPEIADIVQGVSKLNSVRYESRAEKQAENFRKMLIAMAKDVRVVLVKLCDRLHNMRTLEHLSRAKRARIAEETQDIYAPIANRLGLHLVKSELEDLCFLNLRPELYHEVDLNFQKSREERQEFIDRTVRAIEDILQRSAISGRISGRSKHYYSVWQKMERQGIHFEEIHDLLAFRIIVSSVRACYETLGTIHAEWKPIPGLFKDYIAVPKPNMYQSLHSTVVGLEGRRIEIQIRTLEMHQIAEQGVAAHWQYKEGKNSGGFSLQWMKELVDTQAYLKSPDEFIDSVKSELFPDDIFVFTPAGDLLRLPFDATPLDFAYNVHTDVGNTTSGAKVNGQMVTLGTKLTNGDTVEIITSRNQTPKRDWLNLVKSSKARQRIKAHLRSAERKRSSALGQELLDKALHQNHSSVKKMEKNKKLKKLAESFGFQAVVELYAEIGYGKVKVKEVVDKLIPNIQKSLDSESLQSDQISPLQRIFQKAAKAKTSARAGVTVAGLDNVLVRFARCCEPLPGDRITGFVTRGRGISVHTATCQQILNADSARLLKIEWEKENEVVNRKVKINLLGTNRAGLLAAVSSAIYNCNVDVTYSESTVIPELNKAQIKLDVLIGSSEQLDEVRRAIEMVPGIIKVERVIS